MYKGNRAALIVTSAILYQKDAPQRSLANRRHSAEKFLTGDNFLLRLAWRWRLPRRQACLRTTRIATCTTTASLSQNSKRMTHNIVRPTPALSMSYVGTQSHSTAI